MTSVVLLAGCSSDGDDTGSTTISTDQTTTTRTTESETTSETTSEATTSDSTTTSGEIRTVAFGEYTSVGNDLKIAATGGDVSSSYKHDGTTSKSADGKMFGLVTFKLNNSAESSQSLPEGTTASIRADDEQYDVAEPAAKNWQQFVSSSVEPGGSASTTIAFEVPKEAASSVDVAVQLTYSESGADQLIQWRE
ncbi:DUF4352 domain-containing protein [Haladaptatus litoreus]|nr:DUF4352 domain-containing protein [Haladaptatus litoreus]